MKDLHKKCVELRVLWRKFEMGDGLTPKELRRLIAVSEEGLVYLDSRGERLAAAKTAWDLERLRGYLEAHKEQG